MRRLTTETLVHLFQDALSHRDALQHPRLVPFVADFQAHLQRLTAGLGQAQSDDPELEALQERARAADLAHDEAHRALHGLLSAFTLRGSQEQRAAVRRVLDVLYPDRLAFTKWSYAAEVGATEGFAQRLQDPHVRAGLAVVAASLMDLPAWTQACVAAGRAIGQAVQALDHHLAHAKEGPAPVSLFRARNEAIKLWTLYLETVELAYPPERPDSAAHRGHLRQAWEHVASER